MSRITLYCIAKLKAQASGSHPAFQSWRPACQAFSKGVNQPTVMIYVPVFHHPPHPYHNLECQAFFGQFLRLHKLRGG